MGTEAIAQCAGIFALIAGIAAFIIKFCSIISDMAKLELKVDTLWDFLMRRSIAHGLSEGKLYMNSPVSPSASMEDMLEPFVPDLKQFYAKEGYKMTDRDLFIEIERRFGDRMMHDICIPANVYQGTCVLAAVKVVQKKEAA